MDTIRDGKSFEVGGHWPLLRGWKHRMTTQNRQKSNAKKRERKKLFPCTKLSMGNGRCENRLNMFVLYFCVSIMYTRTETLTYITYYAVVFIYVVVVTGKLFLKGQILVTQAFTYLWCRQTSSQQFQGKDCRL
mgnify:CR=1 FL=1